MSVGVVDWEDEAIRVKEVEMVSRWVEEEKTFGSSVQGRNPVNGRAGETPSEDGGLSVPREEVEELRDEITRE